MKAVVWAVTVGVCLALILWNDLVLLAAPARKKRRP
jgi:hypothetical protein